jgi:hypothetical protein
MDNRLARKAAKYVNRFPVVKDLVITEIKGNRRFKAVFKMHNRVHTVQFGTSYDTYFDRKDKVKRDSYRARASKIKNGDGEYTYMKPGTANSFAYWILW